MTRVEKIGRTTSFVSDALSIANLAFGPPRRRRRRRRPICKQRLEEVYKYRDAIDTQEVVPYCARKAFYAPCNPTIFSRISDAPLHRITIILFLDFEITYSLEYKRERERIIIDSSIAVERENDNNNNSSNNNERQEAGRIGRRFVGLCTRVTNKAARRDK